MNEKLILNKNEYNILAGTEVFLCKKYDFGISADDTRVTGIKHISITTDPNGDYPFFSVPETSITKVIA